MIWLDENLIMHECIIAPEYQYAELCLNYVRMLIMPNLSFESESYDSHVIVRAKARLFKKSRTEV